VRPKLLSDTSPDRAYDSNPLRERLHDLIAAYQNPERAATEGTHCLYDSSAWDERYQILTKRVKAHFLPLKKEPDLREKLETFFRGVVQELLPNATLK